MNHESVVACCAICNVKTNRRCSRCLSVYYCNKEHQREDWKRHKGECVPKLTKLPKKSKEERELTSKNSSVNEINYPNDISNHNLNRKSLKLHNHGDQNHDISEQSLKADLEVSASIKTAVLDSNSVISSVVYADNSLNVESAITYEGSSEQEILSETAQQLTSLGFNTSKTVKTLDTKMSVIPEPLFRVPHREYPEASIRGSPAPFSHSPNTYFMDSSDPWYNICQRVIRDMTTYGVCVLDNFLTREKGLLVLNEVLNMYQTGIFQAGQLVSNPRSNEARTIRSDRITWIDGKEPNCYHIATLINQVDNIVLRANKMANNGKMGDYIINGRTKAMVACYPGGGSHYVKHVDNPNKDGRCITTIYYLNLDWDVRRSGGLLRIFPEGTNTVADIEPIFDRMLFFWSDRRNPHEVQPAFDTRYAITLWYFDAQEREEALRLRRSNASQSTSVK